MTTQTLSRFCVYVLKNKKIIAAAKYRPLIDLSDWDIISSINDRDSLKSKEAFEEFFFRFKSFLFKVCRKCCSNFDSSDLLADDIAQNTFLKVYQKAHTFKLKNPNETTNISNEIKAWLSKIARNEFINFLRQNPDEKRLSDHLRIDSQELEENISDKLEGESEQVQESRPSINKEILDNALRKLTERERIVILTHMEFFDASNPKQHLPEDVLNSVCKKFNISRDNVRQIKKRTLKKLMKLINESQ